MDETRLRQIIQQEIASQTRSLTSSSVYSHRHLGSDSPQIASSDLLPYSIVNDVNSNIFNTTYQYQAQSGQIALFDYSQNQPVTDYYNWGMTMFLGNNDGKLTWSEINFADFYLDAYQTTPQTITGSATATIIYDVFSNVEQPTGAYDITTGQFSVVNNPLGQPMDYNSYNKPLWYMVTASVGVAPTTGVAQGDYVNINVVVDGVVVAWNRAYFVPDSAGDYDVLPIIADISVLLSNPITSEIHIELDNGSASDVSTNIAGMEQITYFKIKQLK